MVLCLKFFAVFGGSAVLTTAFQRRRCIIIPMAEMETRFHEAGRSCGTLYVRIKPIFQYVFYLLMIAYQCYDCVSDGMNVYDYYTGDSLDVSGRNEQVYYAFLFSLIVSVVCAVSSSVGYALLVIGLSKKIYRRQEDRNNTFKLGNFIVFVSLFCQVLLEETIQCVVMYYYIVRCSVVWSFWKTSFFVCITLSLIISGYTFFKAAYLWFKKEDSLPRKYPSCLAPCYNLRVSHVGCIALCLFGMILTLVLFGLNIVTLVDIIRYSEVDVPHVLAKNKGTNHSAVELTKVKKLVKSDKAVVEKLPCISLNGQGSHFLGDHLSRNCTAAIFTLSFAKPTKELSYRLHYCYKNQDRCVAVKVTNITLEYSHELCSPLSPVFGYLGDPQHVAKTTTAVKSTPTNATSS